MKNILLRNASICAFLLLFLFQSQFLCGQEFPIERLETSGNEHTITSRGVIKYDLNSEDYTRQNGDQNIFSNGYFGSIRMVGLDSVGNLSVCASTYLVSESSTDFHHGLVDENTVLPIEGSAEFYNKIWKVSDYEIVAMKNLFESGNLTLEDIPENIKTWPAFGNPHIDDGLVPYAVAPFFDRDIDGLYNPLNGDYPIVSTSQGNFVPSQFAFSAYHDVGNHSFSQSREMKMQFFQMQYVINCTESDLHRTVFTVIETKSMSIDGWRDVFFGLFSDHDLGCYEDDRVGYHENTNSVYTYNSGGYDPPVCPLGLQVVSQNISAVKSIIFEDEIYSMHTTSLNFSNPPADYNIYFMLNGYFEDGTPLTYGGSGYNPASTDTVRHLFPDFPNNPNGWSQETADLVDSDYRTTISIDVGDIFAGQNTRQFEFAELTMVSEDEEGFDIFNSYEQRIEDMKAAKTSYILGTSACPKTALCENDCVWPGDANEDGRVDNKDFIYIASLSITEGPHRNQINQEWYPHYSDSWGTSANGIDRKHSDVNGNGEVNFGDILGAESNFGLNNDSYIESNVDPLLNDPYGISMEIDKDEYSVNGNLIERIIRAEVFVGNADELLVDNIRGISYDVSWDNEVFTSSPFFTSIPAPVFDYTNGFYEVEGESNSTRKLFTSQNISPLATKINVAHFNASGDQAEGGFLLRLSWELDESATTTNIDGRDTLEFSFTNIFALNEDGEQIEIGLKSPVKVIVTDMSIVDPTSTVDVKKNNKLRIYPNPVYDKLNFDCKDCGQYEYSSIRSSDGNSLGEFYSESINVGHLPSGIYLLSATYNGEVYRSWFVK